MFQCQGAGGASWVSFPVCDDDSAETTGEDPIPTTEPPESWPPDGTVTLDIDSNEYVIEQDVFEALHDDLAPLQYGGTRVSGLDSGHFYISAQGALAEAMGWKADDVFLSLNDYSLQGLDNVGAAYRDISHDTHFTLTLQRDRSIVVLRYRVE